MSSHEPVNMKLPPIQSTAGAVPVRNEKGELSMEKVKVKRYVSGKRPDYAPMESSDEEEVEFKFAKKGMEMEVVEVEQLEEDVSDPRLKRLLNRSNEDVEERLARHRQIVEPEVVAESSEDSDEGTWHPKQEEESSEEEDEEEEEVDDEEIERRRAMMRQRAMERKSEDMEVMEVEEEGKSVEDSESESEYEEYTDSEDEAEPRLKPVFIRKKDRVTVAEREAEEVKQRELEAEVKKQAEERRRYTLKIVEEEAKKEFEENRRTLAALEALDTDGENEEEEEYESWKVRELKRIKRDREAREAMEKEKAEIERFHSLTEEERRAELRNNGKVITNKASKGKYKFLQKYYHRGAFFLNEDDDVYKRDFSAPTLEDHFNKTILPKVMQVKNFGRSGRTKYTHLVDQDTTSFDSAWAQESAQNSKFFKQKAAGVRDVFDRPTVKKRKT
ncbi:microfibrillar-associated protein 1 [Nematolebias whitei]|uniref:microfibrillar-associated protein 1 n=1 Tax=Nematolebias whitei TaxID=451745 RepID=UPI00189BDBDC|nr:microfibrillar-associated protein 1 [Nematolebias whitei]